MRILPEKCSLFSGGLLSQLSVIALLTTTIILSFFGWQRVQTETDELTRSLYSSLEADSHRLATALELPLYNFDNETVTALCHSLLTDPNITQITVDSNSTQRIYTADNSTTLPDHSVEIISTESSITHNDLLIGKLIVQASTKTLQKQIRQTSRATLLQIFILDLFLVLSIIFFLSKTFIKPMHQLQDAAKNIAEGNLTHSIKTSSHNELGQLGDSLETMRSMLQEKISALETEISERQKTEKELFKTKNYLDNIINSMPSQLIGVDGNSQITLWNKQAETLSNISSYGADERSLNKIFPTLCKEKEEISRAISSRKIIFENARISQSGDSTKYEDITIYPLISNGVEGAVIRIDDVTSQHRMQEELAHSRKLDAIGQLAGGIAHDFNNMLGGIMGGAELLGMHVGDDAKAKRYLELIIESSKRAGELNRKLLSFARKDKIETGLVDVTRAMQETEAILTHSLDKQINISVTIETENTTVLGDLSQLQNALINLGINSGHAMPDGGELTYRIKETQLDQTYCSTSRFDIEPGQYLDIEIRDTGTGIALENQHRIFDPFFTTKIQGKGTGLGLAAVHGTVEQHHGAITLYSEPGKGSCFHIYLPLSKQESAAQPEEESIPVTGSGKILLIDDEPVIAASAKEILKSLGYQVTLAENGEEGLHIFTMDPDHFDLVLTDMVMPKMNGKECFLAMQKIKPNIRVLISSGFSRDTDIEALKEKGLKGFIRKPYTTIELSRAVALAIQ